MKVASSLLMGRPEYQLIVADSRDSTDIVSRAADAAAEVRRAQGERRRTAMADEEVC